MWFFVIGLGCLVYYIGISDIWQMCLDGVYWFKIPTKKTLCDRIHPLFLKYRKTKKLGKYEMHVFHRDFEKYKSMGGKVDYFV